MNHILITFICITLVKIISAYLLTEDFQIVDFKIVSQNEPNMRFHQPGYIEIAFYTHL